MERFWGWYERNYKLNISIALALFALQVVHLVWLTLDVVWLRLFGSQLIELSAWFQWVVVMVDYTEIPALVSVSLVYIHELRTTFSWKKVLYLFFLNIQVLHMFWITDEFVVTTFTSATPLMPAWLAWIAILIDYLEVPVMIDTLKRFLRTT
jgi:hypothetical protein